MARRGICSDTNIVSSTGTRSVITLDAEKLARKRANDREAQRAIRQRTRDYIECLEKRIQELSSEVSSDDPCFDFAFKEAQGKNIELEQELAQLHKLLELNDGSSLQQQLSEQQIQQQPLLYQAQEHTIQFSHFAAQNPQQHSFQHTPFQSQNEQWQIASQCLPPQEREHWLQQY